ncbi:hypothetical protein [Citrobacter amalonaticus]|nr:hypothetical protein [Citrobacter amalonaticus]
MILLGNFPRPQAIQALCEVCRGRLEDGQCISLLSQLTFKAGVCFVPK